MTFLWFIVWIISNNTGGVDVLTFDPVNGWVGALICAIGVDLWAAASS